MILDFDGVRLAGGRRTGQSAIPAIRSTASTSAVGQPTRPPGAPTAWSWPTRTAADSCSSPASRCRATTCHVGDVAGRLTAGDDAHRLRVQGPPPTSAVVGDRTARHRLELRGSAGRRRQVSARSSPSHEERLDLFVDGAPAGGCGRLGRETMHPARRCGGGLPSGATRTPALRETQLSAVHWPVVPRPRNPPVCCRACGDQRWAASAAGRSVSRDMLCHR